MHFFNDMEASSCVICTLVLIKDAIQKHLPFAHDITFVKCLTVQ